MRTELTVLFYVHALTSAAVFAQQTADGNDGRWSAFGDANMTALGTFADEFVAELRNRNETAVVRLRLQMLWMDDRSITARGCGFHVRADGDKNSSAAVRFPTPLEHRCDDSGDTYMMRTTSIADPVVYDARLRLPGLSERAKWVQVRADGNRRTYVEVLCVGTHDWRTGYRSLCVNREVLNACAALTGDSVAEYEFSEEIPMSRSRSGMHILAFQDLDFVFAGFRKLVQDGSDEYARTKFCNGVVWVPGNSYDTGYCDAETTYNVKTYGWHSMEPIPMNPDRCVPVS